MEGRIKMQQAARHKKLATITLYQKRDFCLLRPTTNFLTSGHIYRFVRPQGRNLLTTHNVLSVFCVWLSDSAMHLPKTFYTTAI